MQEFNDKKKIAILAFGEECDGGGFQYTQSMIDALIKDNNYKYIIFCYDSDNRFDDYKLDIKKLKKQTSGIGKKITRLFQLLFFIRKPIFISDYELDLFGDIDIFISPAISAYPHFFLNKPFIFTLHDLQEQYYPEWFSYYKRVLRFIFNRALTRSSAKIICESSHVRNDIMKFTNTPVEKISVIISPPPEFFIKRIIDERQYGAIKSKYNLPDKYIFYPAQCWAHKNHLKLIEAFDKVIEKNNDISLIFTGSQNDNYINIINKINELGLNGRVAHIGYISYEDLPYIYKLSEMLVMPTLFESVSIPIYEAFALKVPVCSSNVVALPEQVGNAGLIFNPNDAFDIAKKILMYLDDKDFAKEMGQKGYNKIMQFNHDEYRKKLLTVINESI
jgi:glycosyltransferase involved in cell wall biosynthesis